MTNPQTTPEHLQDIEDLHWAKLCFEFSSKDGHAANQTFLAALEMAYQRGRQDEAADRI